MTQRGGLTDIPGCTIEGELGRGGMATVYLATQKLLDRKVGKGIRATLPRLPIIVAGGVAGLAAIGTLVWFLTTGQPLVVLADPRVKLLGDRAHREFQAGNLAESASIYQQIMLIDNDDRHAERLAAVETGLRAVASHSQLRTERERVRRSPADQGVQRTLANLLAQAERQTHTGELRDALASYRRALALAPTSEKAQRGLKRLSELYAASAQRAIEQNDESGATSIVEEGLRVDPDFPPLLALRTKLEQARQVEQQRGMLRQSLSDAARQLHEGNLKDAVASYRGAIGLDPTSNAAREGLQAVANAYADRAEQARDEGSFDTGLRAVAQGLRVVPGSQRLVSLQVDLRQRLSDAAAAERRDQRVRELLQQANAQIARNLLTTPAAGNAFDTLRNVLAIDPDNPEVDAALGRIAGRYARFASSRLQRGDLEGGLDYVETGLQVAPENSQLLGLREQIASEQARRAALQQELATLLVTAERHFAQGQLTARPGENTVRAYREVLRIDPSNRQARQRLQRIADQYADRARSQLRAGSLEQSAQAVEDALSVLPQNPTLLALRTEIREAIADRSDGARTDNAVRTLLARANNEVQAGRLIASTGDDAFGLFRHVLEMAPDNEGALDGLDGIYNHYLNAAREDRQGKRYQNGLLNIDRALKVKPSDRVALVLQQDLQREMSAPKAADGLRIAVLPWDLGKDAIGNGDIIARAVADAVNQVSNVSITHHFDSRVARRLDARHVPIDGVGIWQKINPERPGQPNAEAIYTLAEDLDVDAVLMCSIVEDGEFMFPEADFALFVVDVKNRKVVSQRQVERESSYQAPVGFSAGTGAGIVRQLTRKALDEYRANAKP